jgi:hypothetical protein
VGMMELHEKGTAQEASDSEADWAQSTACWEVGCSSSAKFSKELNRRGNDWKKSTAYL